MTNEDQDAEMPPVLEAEVSGHMAVLLKERGRAKESGNAFYDKIAALSAGSIALAVPVGITILNKPDLHHLVHGLLAVIVCFWLSLLTAIAHNFLLLWSVKLSAVYARDEFIKSTFKTMFRHFQVIPDTDPNQWRQIQRSLLEDPLNRQRITNARMERCELAATVVGIFSISCFFIGYTLVVVGALRIWL